MIHKFTTFELDEELFELREGNARIAVQPKVLELLIFLVRTRERVVQKQEIMAAVWPDVVVGEGSLARAAMAARRAIRDDDQSAIVTVRGRGLRFVLDVVSEGKSAPAIEGITPLPRIGESAVVDAYTGRDREDALLASRLAAAEGGEGGVVWLTGEAGIGKSRTVDQLCRGARARDLTVLVGLCHESPGAPPYRPWVQIARAWLHTMPPAERETQMRAIATLLSDVVPDSAAPARVVADDPSRFRLYDAFFQRLAEAARKRPMLIVIEDLHRADAPSLELIGFFARELREVPILLVGTCRDNEIADDGDPALGALLTAHGARSIALRPLDPEDVTRMAEASLGKRLDAVLAAKIHEKSGGNPLYVMELLQSEWLARALVRSGVHLHSSIDVNAGLRASIVRHLHVLSEGSVATLTAAALLGQRFELPVLSAVIALSSGEVVDHLEEAVRARIVVREGLSRFRFLHALVRDVLYQRLPAGERFTLHRAAADALALHWGTEVDEHLAEVATHLLRAAPGGDAERAVQVAIRAANLAKDNGDATGAAALRSRAMEALSLVGSSSASGRLAALRRELEAAIEAEKKSS